MANVVNKIVRGTFGRLWVNGRHMANVKEFEAKITANYETVQVNGNFTDQYRYIGNAIAGTILLHKTDSYFTKLLAEAFESGVMPSVTIDARLADLDSNGSERIALYDVVFDELTILKFTNGGIGEESVPFKAGAFKVLDTIE